MTAVWILLLQLFVGLILIATGEDQPCPVLEFSPTRVVVKHGDPASVNCSLLNNASNIGWEVSQGGISITPARYLMWTVESVTDWDMIPMCYTKDFCIRKLNITIYTFPDNININSSEVSGEMKENMEYHLTCSILNIAPVQNLTVRWYKDNTIIYTDVLNSDIKRPTDQTSILRLTPTRNDSQASFRCEAHMDLGPEGPQFKASSGNYTINVLYGPDVECSTLRENETLGKRCKVTGNPFPDFQWLKDGRPISTTVPLGRNDTGMYTFKDGDVERDIHINVLYGPEWICPHTYTTTENSFHNLSCSRGFPKPDETWYKDGQEVKLPPILTRNDAGQYMVNVSNNDSNIQIPMKIFILYAPSEMFELEDSEVPVGESLVLTCSSAGNPPPNYSWSFYQMTNVQEKTDDRGSSLILHNVTGYNTGFYTCVARNEQGNVSKTVRVTVKGAEPDCPIEIIPSKMVLPYLSGRRSVQCKPKTDDANVEKIFWRTQDSVIIANSSWFADTSKDWDPQPVCHGEFKGIGSCSKTLNYTLYKTPESVSIRVLDDSSVEGSTLQLQCSVISVAPAENVCMRWMFYRGNETIKPESVGLSSNKSYSVCPSGSNRYPVNISDTMNITLQKIHNGIRVQCEAELDLRPAGPKLPIMTSSTYNITVFYEPRINTTKLPGTFPVFRGYPELLVCEADGNPPPTIRWVYGSKTARVKSEGNLSVSDEGVYICNATNYLNFTLHEVKVILLEDYQPLIAGVVALTVLIISIVFIFIYSIYYKNTKMRRYSLKNPKFSSQNGNVANNGWDMQLPVTKLS